MALSINSNVITSNGFKNVKCLNKGDFIFGGNGQLTEIKEIKYSLNLSVRINFRDKSFVDCSLNHNWLLKTGLNSKKGPNSFIFKTFPLEHLLNKGLNTKHRPKKFSVPLTNPLIYDIYKLEIPPYFLGLLLGDGSLHGGAISLTVNNNQLEIIDYINNILPDSMETLTYKKEGCHALFFVQKNKKSNRSNWLKSELNKLGLLVKGNNKFIPDIYKYNSIESRKELIKGLMDSDGAITQGSVIFHNKNEKLIQDFGEVIRSLGLKALPRFINRKDKGVEYLTNIQTDFNPFNLISKKSLWNPPKDKPFNSLIGFEYLKKEEEMVSIITEGRIILVNDFIMTYGD